VGERMAAKAKDEAYGAVSVKVAYWATASVVGRVSAQVFIPRPRVESVLVRLDRRSASAAVGPEGTDETEGPLLGGPGSPEYDRLFSVVRGGFAHRRKMLRRSLDGLVSPEAFVAMGIPSTARAEELALDEWERLAAWLPSGVGEKGGRGQEPEAAEESRP
jgi:16S rRNA (adenine1518-N6/adenine1519-N6)-dimethyltransferase